MFNKTVYQKWASGDKAHLYSQNVLPWTVTVDGFIEPFHKDIDDQAKRMLFLYRNPVPICQCVDCATAQGGSFWGSGEHQHWVYNLGQLPSPPTAPPYTYSYICSTGLYSPGHQSHWCEWRNWQSDRCNLDCREFLKSPAVQRRLQSKLHTDSQLSSHSQLGLWTVEGSPTLSHSLDSKLQRPESSAIVVKMVMFVLEASTCVNMSVWSRDDLFEFIEELKKY